MSKNKETTMIGSSSTDIIESAMESTFSGSMPSLPSVGQTGYSFCTSRQNVQQRKNAGMASFQPEGRMASMYIADRSSTYRCSEVTYPDDELFVALWTQYQADLEGKSQPAPINCGQKMMFRNPVNGNEAEAVVLDRCASCVGVNRSPQDPNMGLQLVNGATVDLSAKLWDILYNGEEGAVFDIEYGGSIWAGSDQEPKGLEESDRHLCST
ncbi:Hypothetical protein D9617_46g064320 [Elsinoe fawcettii]|nr:Hypothetical protein D9617_46g064320 [Elsinoe fawcettii]